LVSSANLIRMPLSPSSKSLIKVLNKTGPKTEPCGTPLVTLLQDEEEPLMSTLWLLYKNIMGHLVKCLAEIK
ncbi:Calponin-homology (CH) domain-containing protein, partial [Podarcis lilfordi]